MKRKIFTLLVSALFGSMAMAQAPEAILKKAAVAPVIDGVMDAAWVNANVYNIAVPFKEEVPTLGAEGTTTWRGLWTDEGIYILLTVNDDVWMPDYLSGQANYMSDKPELYFDVNAVKLDGGGPGSTANIPGHYQVAPGTLEADIHGVPKTGTDGVIDAYEVADPAYKVEYFIPFSKLLDKDGKAVDLTAPIGFDVTIIDIDTPTGVRQRADWSNNGSINESWSNMDGCGTITLSEEVAQAGGIINKTTTAPKIDGVFDAVWDNATKNDISVPFKTEVATVGAPGETYWKGLWDDNGMYIIVKVADDNWFPFWAPGGGANSYEYDKVELYFDTNQPRKDGKGGQGATPGSTQIAPDSKAGGIDGTMLTGTSYGIDYNYAYNVSDPQYTAEYFIPWDILNDKDGVAFDKTTLMGFDVTVIDRDPGDAARKRVNWANAGVIDENWNNMDDAGVLMFDGATTTILVEKITVASGGVITTDNGTSQMTATFEPSDATMQKAKWSVQNGTGRATINNKGLLTGLVNGDVTVVAEAMDGSYVSAKIKVNISGQVVTMDEISMIKNGNFELGTDGMQSWGTAGTVVDSWYSLVCTPKVNIWDTMFGQGNIPVADASTPYTVKFKAVATANMTVPMLFEDRNNGNNKTQSSGSLYRDNSYGKWDIPVTTEAKWYTIDVTFSGYLENSAYELNFQAGMLDGTFSIDSIQMVSNADLALISSAKTLLNVNRVQLYPNPVQTELTVSGIVAANSKVSVYNAVGQKLIEKTANGTQAKFDVANLRKGMYFVRFSDGSSEKFIKQ